MTELTFLPESIVTMRSEVGALFDLHWQEIAENKEALQVDVKWSTYETLERVGKLVAIAARRGSILVGYFIAVVDSHPHYQRVIFANEDIHFLHRDYRIGLNGKKLIEAAMAEARKRGAEFMTGREKIAHPHSALWKRLGFRPIDTCYIAKL
jgi:hypothetical protein